ncbi:four helix bundle protein [Winogradskyella sp. J14-2]|uniref:four helix bundle protein n=1 Tax=Winogradskyella sp. J14-2 TaxID=1936080 RepID=UPI0009727678|nr:four helix bundle protein [Winogradskyella sp. J14-2]APY07428.1 four helix bundle protein [Winogradskyella sp. J14-2]
MKVQDLIAYRKGFKLAMDIYEISKSFPKEETYSLTDQIRRSSRSICANLSEAYRKRRYPKHFISKLTDCDAENGETQTWLEFAAACKYISLEQFELLNEESLEVAKLLNYMILNPEKFGSKKGY